MANREYLLLSLELSIVETFISLQMISELVMSFCDDLFTACTA